MRDDTEKNPIASRHCDQLVYGESYSRVGRACSRDNNGEDEGWRWSDAVE
jgi:hypothetical protein